MSEIKVNKVTTRSGSTVTVGDGAGETVTVDAATVTLGRCGGTVALACGASSSGFGAISWCSAIKTAAFCAAAGKGYFINTCGGTFEVTLPASATVGDQINFTDYARTWGAACKEFTVDQNSLKFQGQTSPKPEYDTAGATVKIIYADATQGWIPQLDKGVANEVPQAYNVQYLVVAGGASGGVGDIGGGGGAGGYRFTPGKSFEVSVGTPVTVTVGAGGAQRNRCTTYQGNPGSNSVFSTITSAAGGGGGAGAGTPSASSGLAGGSGGGAGYRCNVGGAGNTPPTSPSQGNAGGDGATSSQWYMGGGGGHAAAGADGTPSGGGCGGIGTPSALDFGPLAPSYGTPGPAPGRYFAGGGGGGKEATGCAAAGGAGGGGKGSSSNTAGVAGTVNTGGGGGGGEGSNPTGHGYAGGKGIVAIRYVTACATACAAGGDASATCGSDTIRVFTGDGTFVP